MPGEYVFSAVVKINDGLVLVEEALTVRGDLEAKFNASPPLERGDVRLAIDCDGEPAEGKFEVFVNSSLTSRMLEYTGRPPGGGLISSTAQVYPLSKPEVAIPVRLLDCFVIVVPPDSELAAASIHRVVHERGSRLDPPRLVHSCVAPGWLELSVTVEAPSASEEHQPWGAGTLHRDSHRRNLSAPLLHLGSEAVLDANYYPRDGDDPDVRTRELEPGQTYRSYWLPPGDYAVHPS